MKNRVTYTIITVLAVSLVAVLLYRLIAPDVPPPEIVLPVIPPSETHEGGTEPGLGFIDRGEISYDALMSIISALRVSEEYSREYRIADYYSDGTRELRFTVWARGDDCLIVQRGGADNAKESTLLRGDTVMRWRGDDYETAYSGSTPPGLSRQRLRDMYQHLYSIENLLLVPAGDLVYACFADLNSIPCIYAEFHAGEFGILNKLFIGSETGLVMAEERYDEGILAYQMESLLLSLVSPDENVFSPTVVSGR